MAAAARQGGADAHPPRGTLNAGVDPIAPATSTGTEQTVARLHPSSRRLILPAIIVVAVCAATGFLAGNLPEEWENVALPFVAATVILFTGVFPLLFWLNRVYLITTRRIVAKRGLFTRERREILHSRTHQIVLRRGPLQILARSGDIVVMSGEEELFRLADVPSADLVHEALLHLVEHGSSVPLSRSRQPEETRRPFDPS